MPALDVWTGRCSNTTLVDPNLNSWTVGWVDKTIRTETTAKGQSRHGGTVVLGDQRGQVDLMSSQGADVSRGSTVYDLGVLGCIRQ